MPRARAKLARNLQSIPQAKLIDWSDAARNGAMLIGSRPQGRDFQGARMSLAQQIEQQDDDSGWSAYLQLRFV